MAPPGSRFPAQSPGTYQAYSPGWLVLLLLIAAAPTAAGQSLAGCSSNCGDVEVPYPFGLSRSCSRDETFVLTCNSTSNDGASPPTLYITGSKRGIPPGGYRVFNISILHGYVGVSLFLLRDCYARQGGNFSRKFTESYLSVYVPPPLSISPDRNTFVSTGCDVYFWYWDNFDRNGFWTGCLAGCGSLATVVNNSCNGFGCCESGMPKGLRTLEVVLQSYYNHSEVFDFNPCSYSFIIERDKFAFDTSWIITDYTREARPQLSTALDWSIEGTADCVKAKASSTYACASANSVCVASPNGLGYLCNCSAGYTGNPYLQGGCQDIDECKLDRRLYPCYGDCTNTPGSYNCSCPTGTYSDDPKNFKCVSKSSILSLASKLLIGIGSGVLSLALIVSIVYLIFQKRKLQQLRKKFFAQNGGIFLQQSILSHQQSSFKIFTMDDIEKATQSFRKDFILGRGGFGMVYKGILDDGRVIAVKKSIMIDEKRNKEFAKELLILSQVNHKNIVKLLGCCLESEIPMLVYEYVANGTLFDYIHKKKHNLRIPLTHRMKFAIESAEALRYLHIDASPSILHGDVKSSNFLLDENLVIKVSDFGTSILGPKDRAQFTTFVQGTCGYLDPEYMQTSQLTDKSDVYSFGVILLELLTGRKPFYFEEPEKEQNLAFTFLSKMNENKLIDILDQDIIDEGDSQEVNGVVELAIRCLRLTGDERPSMKEVVTVLERLYGLKNQVHTNESIGVKKLDGQDSFNVETTEYTTNEIQRLLTFKGR